MDALSPELIAKREAWSKYKFERRQHERVDRTWKKVEREKFKKLVAEAASTGSRLMRRKKKPYRKYPEMGGGRAAARNMQFKRPAVGNRKVFHRKTFFAKARLVMPGGGDILN